MTPREQIEPLFRTLIEKITDAYGSWVADLKGKIPDKEISSIAFVVFAKFFISRAANHIDLKNIDEVLMWIEKDIRAEASILQAKNNEQTN